MYPQLIIIIIIIIITIIISLNCEDINITFPAAHYNV